MVNNKEKKSLSEVFKELEKTKNKQIEEYKELRKQQIESSFAFHIKHRTKQDNIRLIIIVLFILLVVSMFSSNYIFAKDLDVDVPKEAIAQFEENANVTDIYEIISENISSSYQKEIFDREEEVGFETEYIENKDLPKDETIIVQEGKVGKKQVTYVRTYENNEIVEENSIGYIILEEVQKEIIEVGTSETLKEYNIHIGDNLFVSQDIELRKLPDIESETISIVPAYYDVKTLEIIDEIWLKLDYNENTGYIICDYLTSEKLTPGITEISRKKKILDKVNFNMNLNEPSGLEEKDFEKVFISNPKDTNNIFKENYKFFKEVEDKYNINGVFIAAIAIHESGWGKSAIAMDKKNLFGFRAYDETPYESALTYENYGEGIDKVAKWLVSNYLNPSGTTLKTGEVANGLYYNGANVTGVNVRYASDENWSTKIFETMSYIYNSI